MKRVAFVFPVGVVESSCHQTALLSCCAWSLDTQRNIIPTTPAGSWHTGACSFMPRGTCTQRGQCQGCPVWSSVACALPPGGLESSCHQTAQHQCCAWSLKAQHNINPTTPPNPRTPRVGPTPQENTLHRHRHTPNVRAPHRMPKPAATNPRIAVAKRYFNASP